MKKLFLLTLIFMLTICANISAQAWVSDIGTVFNNAQGTSLQITSEVTVSVGNTIIVGFSSRGTSGYSDPTIVDDAGNTYQLATGSTCYANGRTYIYYSYVETALNIGDHITITSSNVYNRVAVASAFSGILSVSPLDQSLGNPLVTNTSTQTQGNNPTVGPVTTTQAAELIISMIGAEDNTVTGNDAGVGTWGN